MDNNAFTMADYERLLAARYRAGGHTRETAIHFAQGEIRAILAGNHWTHGKPTAPDPQHLITEALSPEDRKHFTERAAILEYEAVMRRADAEARALQEIISRKYPAPEKPVYQGSAAIRKTLAAGIGIKEYQITAPGSEKENGSYVLHGELADAPPLYGFLLDHIEKVKRQKEQEKAARQHQPRTRAVADQPVRFDKPRITLDDLAGEAAPTYSGHHDNGGC